MGGIDRKRYARVLAKFQPEVIETKAQYQEALAAVEELMDAGDKRTPEQTAVYLLLAKLVMDYEERAIADQPESPPNEVLAYLLEKRGLKQIDLVPIFKSRGYVSDILKAKRPITGHYAKALGKFFEIPADVFL
jgi:HTH-type transcriptional regulator / antitoxin HigA